MSESDEFEVIDQLEASLSPEELEKVQAWLQPTDYTAPSSEFNRHLSSQAPGTGLWICETSKYAQWQSSVDHGSLWIKGVPGAGKSVTAASMVQHLQKTDTPVLYFFFRHIISANRRPRSLIRDYLAQLLPYSARLQATLQPLTGTELGDFSDEILWEHLLTGLSSVQKAYCVVDALDEMEMLPNDNFLARLNALSTLRPESVKLLMTSRPKQYLQASLKDTSIVHISLEDDLVGEEIRLFLAYRLRNILPGDDHKQTRESLVSTISERSRGLFLYARLLLDQIIPKLSSTKLDISTMVANLPVGLEEMYNTMLFKQSQKVNVDVSIQLFLLELATHSSRALRLNEVANILVATFPNSMIPDGPKEVVRLACAPLLEISEDETIQVIHHSFTEFLLNPERLDSKITGSSPQFPVLNTTQVHKRLTIVCLDYLKSGTLQNDGTSIEKEVGEDGKANYDFREAKLAHPFLEYAVGNWAFHASKYDANDDDFLKSIQGFLNTESPDFKQWLELEWTTGMKITEEPKAPTPLHIAAFAGLTSYAEKLIRENVEIDARDAKDRTPLYWACLRGHESMVSLLLKAKAAPDPDDFQGSKPIHEAARKNHSSIVKILLEHGVNPLTCKTKENQGVIKMCGYYSSKDETAVEYAYLQGHTDTLKVMLSYLSQEDLEELLCQCCRYGKFEPVRAIFEATSVSPNSVSCGATALYFACQAHNPGIVSLLLDQGADVNQTTTWWRKNRGFCGGKVIKQRMTTNVHACVNGWTHSNNIACHQVLTLLCKAGVNLEAVDAEGDTALLWLFRYSHSEPREPVAIRGLLQAGANVNAVNKDGSPVLHRSLQRNGFSTELLNTLLEYGARVDDLDNEGGTALHAVLGNYGGDPIETGEVVKLLLLKGISCDVENQGGDTALEVAVKTGKCSLETFKLLLESCSNIKAPKRCLWRLKCVQTEHITKYIRELQARGVWIDDRNKEGETLLLQTTSYRDTTVFEALIDCGADINAIDAKGQGVLHHFVLEYAENTHKEKQLERLQQFVDLGLDPKQVDLEGNNLLHLAAKAAKRENEDPLITKLMSYGISVNSKNKQGMTPLHINLEAWDFTKGQQKMVDRSLEERFYEREEMCLLKVLRCGKEALDIDSQDNDGLTILHLAALRSETRLCWLIEEGADPLALTKEGRNALHLACRAQQSNVVGFLCKNYPSMINQCDIYNRTPLHDACASGVLESVNHLLKAGAAINIFDDRKRTCLHACAEFADELRLQTLLGRSNSQSSALAHDRFRPYRGDVMTAARISNIDIIVKKLILAGSDVLAMHDLGRTPLELAIEYDCKGMIQALEFTADAAQREAKNRFPSTVDIKTRMTMRLRRLAFTAEELREPRYLPVLQNLRQLEGLTHYDLVSISELEEDISLRDEDKSKISLKESVLHIAIENGFTDIVERLNSSTFTIGCWNSNEQDTSGKLPDIETLKPQLHRACSRAESNMDMLELLIDKLHVNVNAHIMIDRDKWTTKLKNVLQGGTALHVLSEGHYSWQPGALKYLLSKGADICSLNEAGETPLHIACTGPKYSDMNCKPNVYGYWRIECVKLLVKEGAEINVVDNDGLSCLHKASTSPKILQILLENGANLSLGKLSPVFSAIQMQCLEAVKIFLDAGVSPNIVVPDTALDGFSLHYQAKNEGLRPALYCATFPGLHNQREYHMTPIIQLLIERGADVYAPLNGSDTLIHNAMEFAEYEMLNGYMACGSRIDFNRRDSKGRTVFLAACDWLCVLPGYKYRHWDKKATAPFLLALDHGADPIATDDEGRNALHHLLDNPSMVEEAIIQFLQLDAAKSLLFQKDAKGFTPLNCALRFLRPAVVEVLLSMGADLLSTDPNGATALHHIAAQCITLKATVPRRVWCDDRKPEFYAGALALWQKFLSLGGSINVRDNTGAPPLFYYLSCPEQVAYKQPATVCCHLDHYAQYFEHADLDLQARNDEGENALHIIAKRPTKQPETNRRGHGDEQHDRKHEGRVYEFFVKRGLGPLEEDGRGRTSLDVAAACEQSDILALFQYRK